MFSQFKELRAQLMVEQALRYEEGTAEELSRDHPGYKVFQLKDRTFLPRDGTEYKGIELEPCLGFFVFDPNIDTSINWHEGIELEVMFGTKRVPWKAVKKCVLTIDYDEGLIVLKLWAVKKKDGISSLIESSKGACTIVFSLDRRYAKLPYCPPLEDREYKDFDRGVKFYPMKYGEIYDLEAVDDIEESLPFEDEKLKKLENGVYLNATPQLLKEICSEEPLTEDITSIRFGEVVPLFEEYWEKPLPSSIGFRRKGMSFLIPQKRRKSLEALAELPDKELIFHCKEFLN